MAGPPTPRRLVRWAMLVLAAILPVAVAGACALLWVGHQEASRWPSLDQVPPIVAGPPPLPGDERAWALLAQAAAAHDDGVDWKMALSPVGPPAAADREIWRRDADALSLAEQALDRPGLTIPLPDHYLGDFPDMVPYQMMTRAWCLRGWDRALAGDLNGAVDDMLIPVDLGQRFMDGENALLPAMVGIAMQGIALTELAELMDTTAADRPDVLVRAGNALLSRAESLPAVARALAWECAAGEQVFRDDMADLASQGGSAAGKAGPGERLLFAVGYDPDTTIAWHRTRCGHQVAQASRPWPEREDPDFERLWPWSGQPTLAQLTHNPAGRILIEMAMPDHRSFVEREDRLRANQRGHALVWAARAHALHHDGAPPADAAVLVPDYLDHLPADPFAAGPLQLADGEVFSAADGKERVVGEIADLRWRIDPG